jgi:hypothetical protein
MSSLFWSFAQRLAQDVAEVVELQKELTQAWVAAFMVGARTTWAEGMAPKKVIVLASAHGEVHEVAQKISLLEGELVVVHQAWDVAKAKLPDLVDRAATVNQRQEEAEGQCEHLAEELTLLWLRGSDLCLTIVDAPPRDPLHE